MGDIVGVYFGELSDKKRFAVVVRNSATTVMVAAPYVTKKGFQRTIWTHNDGEWTSGTTTKKYRNEIAAELKRLLPE